ncbi:baculoviral IAP repeat-containing protein 5 isoform X1 [Sus scrofa]|uniref:Baculoviral IAP repeat-containing protein 5 n=1 Tax=Sus scrofa TaxID=9823 RepID=A0A8D1X7P8_PIG|nr:baculoviral IAP repeat-containing protein 5 isoform X1 [Sus scrofa]
MSAPSLPPAWQLYLKDHRISTFKNWPFLEGCACTPERMAAAGFIHCPTENEPDLAQCFFCFKELEGWEPDDDPMPRKPTISRKNLKKLQRKSAVPLSSWLPQSDASPPSLPPATRRLRGTALAALPAFLQGHLAVSEERRTRTPAF